MTNSADDDVSAYKIDTAGALKPVPGSPFAAGAQPTLLATYGKSFLYVADQNYPSCAGGVSGYSIDAQSGALTAVVGSPFTADQCPYAVAVDANGFVYVANVFSSDISAYTINVGNGALMPILGSPFETCCQPEGVTVSPAGTFAYVPNTETNNVSAYAIDSGALTQISGSPFRTGTTPENVVVDPTGKFAYVTDINAKGSRNISGYQIDQSSGALVRMPGSPFRAGTNPRGLAVSPAGNFIFVANSGSNNVSVFAIDANTGSLTPVPGSPFAAGTEPLSLAVDANGKFVYVANGVSNNISGYKINQQTGLVTPLSGSPFPSGNLPTGIAVTAPN